MRYKDFVIQISPGGERCYVAQVLAASQGQTSWDFDPPFSSAELRSIDAAMAQAVRQRKAGAVERNFQPEADGEGPAVTSQAAGARLFRTLLSEEIRPIFERELALARREGHGLRLRLKIDLGRPELLALYNLPWELLYNPDTQDFLGLSREVALVRYLDVKRPENTLKRPRRLRILAVMADPTDLPRLDLESEAEALQRRVSGAGVELTFLRNATRETLHRALAEQPFHILHFMGHGALRSGEGCIVLETADHHADPIRASSLVQDLRDPGGLQLVVLNACDTAEAPNEQHASPFEGVATALILGGIPAVIGMRYPISDAAALAFSEHFYHQLAAGEPIDAAMAQGRQAIFRLDDESFEWAKPILFLRSQKGEIWPSKAWSRIKKATVWALSLLLAASFWSVGSRPGVRSFFELRFTAEGRKSQQLAAAYWNGKVGSCNSSSYALMQVSRPEDEKGNYSLFQFKDLHWRVEPLHVTEAARLDGVEYLARSTVQFSSFRSVRAPGLEWSAWESPREQPFTPSVAIVESKGQWRTAASSPHAAVPVSSGIETLVPVDCGWLHDGRFDPSKLKAVWGNAADDIAHGDLERAEAKILLGRAWSSDDSDLLLLLARLRFAQADLEPTPAARGRLRFQGVEALIAAVKKAAAQYPNGGQILDVLSLIEGARSWLCSQARLTDNNPWIGFALRQLAGLLRREANSFDDDPLVRSLLQQMAETILRQSGNLSDVLRETGVCG